VIKKIFYSASLDETYNIASIFFKELKAGDIIVLDGNLGVGKTEFVRAICKNLNISNVITSPTFTLINQYHCESFDICHIDLFRIKNKNELIGIGFQELFDGKNFIFFIEWAENSFDLIPEIDYKISIKHNDNENSREIIIENYK